MTQTVGWTCSSMWLMLFVALTIRMALAFGVQARVSQNPGQLCLIPGDAEGYWDLAGKLARGEAYSIYEPPRRLLRMPGFPLLLALPRFVFGDYPFAARLVLAGVGTLACGLTYWLGRELAGNTIGLIAGWYTAVSPSMALFSVLFLSETAFAASLLASLIAAAIVVRRLGASQSNHGNLQGSSDRLTPPPLLLSSPAENLRKPSSNRGSVWLPCVTGVLIGIATYMRPTWLLVGPGLDFLIIVLGRVSLRSRFAQAGWICLGLAIMLSPWTIRNAIVTGHFVPTTLWLGPSLYDGLNPTATGDSDMTFFDQDQLLRTMSEYEMDREYRRRAWAFAAANPGRVLSLALAKQQRYWNPAPNAEQFRNPWIHAVGWLAFLPLVGFAIVGAWFARGDIWLLILTSAPILYFAALHLLFVGSLRYRLPAEYPLSVLSALGVWRFVHRDRMTTV